jgi:hypothetical protein
VLSDLSGETKENICTAENGERAEKNEAKTFLPSAYSANSAVKDY